MNPRQWLIRLVLAALLLGGLAGLVESEPSGPREPLDAAWSRSLDRVIALAVSPDGERVLGVDQGGTLHCYDRRGTFLWRQAIGDVDRVVTSRNGALTLAYPANQPLAREVTFLDASGRRLDTLKTNEAVRTAVVAPDGRYAAIAAGRTILFCARGPHGVRRRSITLPGVPRQLQFGPDDSLYVASEQPHGIFMVKSSGRVVWRRQAPDATASSLAASEDGKRLSIALERPQDLVEVILVDHLNRKLWSVQRPGRGPRARLCANGTTVMLAYEHQLSHNDEKRYERRLAYLPDGERGSWTKGGAYTAPLYVAVDRAGEWVVALDTQRHVGLPRLRLYGRDGKSRWVYSCPASILIATASAEGRHIAAYRADGVLEMVEVTGP